MASTLRQRNVVTVAEVDLTTGADQKATFTPPAFTVKDLLSAIPKHCFERSAIRSTAYLLGDMLMAASLFWAASFIDPSFGEHGAVLDGPAGTIAKWAAWTAYWIVNGFVLTGIWVLAHECGHQAFSTSKTYNNFVGLILHTFLLVPYHSWRISHARHHAATGHMTRDEVFVPRTRSSRVGDRKPVKVHKDGLDLEELLEDAPLYRLTMLLFQQLLGWPAYLFLNVSGQPHFPASTNHFSPYSHIFDVRHRPQIVLSDAALLVMGGLLYAFKQQVGWSGLVKYYVIPYLMVNHWLVMITFLQHTDPTLPHYRAAEWTFARGALCTVDRTLMGPLGAIFFHGICETHVSHHISSKIPHYNAWEATEALEKFLGEHYRKTDENMFVSLWKNAQACRFVEDEGDVVFYKDAYGRSAVTVKYDSATDSGVDVSGDEIVEADC